MPSPAARLFECLEALQERPAVTGAELAERLDVDRRTVRRYVTTLQELGIPVVGERGTGGGYRLRPGYRLPPLMLDDDEAAVVVLGLLAVRAGGIESAVPATERALAKLRRVLPDRLRRRVDALAQVTGATAPPAAGAPPRAEVLLDLADAAERGSRVRCRYTRHDGSESGRDLSPYGLVVHHGRWYLAAYDHGREAMRTFRVDRLTSVRAGGPGRPAPSGFDPADHVRRALVEVPWTWAVEVTVELPRERVAAQLPAGLATLVAEEGGRTRVRMRVEELDWMAGVLAGLGAPFVVHEPAELRASVVALAHELLASAAQG